MVTYLSKTAINCHYKLIDTMTHIYLKSVWYNLYWLFCLFLLIAFFLFLIFFTFQAIIRLWGKCCNDPLIHFHIEFYVHQIVQHSNYTIYGEYYISLTLSSENDGSLSFIDRERERESHWSIVTFKSLCILFYCITFSWMVLTNPLSL